MFRLKSTFFILVDIYNFLEGLEEKVVAVHFTLLLQAEHYISFISTGIKIFAVAVSQHYYGNNHVAKLP
jgi:hypothetical protein